VSFRSSNKFCALRNQQVILFIKLVLQHQPIGVKKENQLCCPLPRSVKT
jgi:hypothetical protein